MTWRIAAVLACATLLTGCAGDRGLAQDLRAAVEVAEDSGAVLDLSAVVAGDWDRLTVVCPYEDAASVTERLGFAWDDFPGEDLSESAVRYVFSTAEEVVTWTELDRPEGDACTVDGHRLPALPRADTRFDVVRDGESSGGEPWLRLVPVD